jgi:hypothetical protein
MADTFEGVARKVLLRCESAGLLLARDWVRNAFHDIIERRQWSWLIATGQLTTVDEYTTGTATIAAGDYTVTITTGVVSESFVGRQFRGNNLLPIATITAVDTGANTLTLDQALWPDGLTAAGYSIYQAYLAVPSDFQSFMSVIDPQFNLPIPTGGSVERLDIIDAQRVASGSSPRRLVFRDYYNGLPRYELWPHNKSAAVYPMVYIKRPIDAFEEGATIPSRIPADILLERAMMYCAQWPGASAENKNPYYSQGTAQFHEAQYEKRLAQLERQDNAHMPSNFWYQSEEDNGGGWSASFMQSHDIG